MTDRSSGRTRPGRRRLARASMIATTTAGLLVGLLGCSQVGIEANTFESGPLPAVPDGAVTEVLAALDRTVNEANAARDPELLATVVADPLLATETARYALDAMADPDDATPLPVVDHTDPTVFVPRFADYPQWFVVAGQVVADTPLRLEVLTRDTASAAWTVPFATDLLVGVEFPELDLDEAGYVVPVAAADLTELALAPADVAAAHVAGLNPTATDDAFAADGWTATRRDQDAQRGTAVGEAATVGVTYDVVDVLPQVLRTADGGAVVCYVLRQEVVYEVQPTYFLQLDEPTAALVGTSEVVTSLTEQWTAALAVHVPPDGDPRVVAARVDRVGLTGS